MAFFLENLPQRRTLLFLFIMGILSMIMWLASASAAINGLGEIETVAAITENPDDENGTPPAPDPETIKTIRTMANNTNNGQIVLLVLSICAMIAFGVGLFVMWWNQHKAEEQGGGLEAGGEQ